jgi:hypothetical protein
LVRSKKGGSREIKFNYFKEEGMRKLAIGIVVVVAISMMFVQVSFAQGGEGKWTLGIPSLTDAGGGFTGKEAIVLETGKVVAMEPMKGVKGSVQMKFKNDQGNAFTVFMGPKWFVDNQKLKFAAGDSVVVKGKKFSNYIIATAISKGNMTMKLRSQEDGMPSWECCTPGTVTLQ